jgi:endonuclease/exonuclease/phosphatase family metal-dependent hydrolase
MRLRVGTYNIHAAVGLDRRYDPPRIARVLTEIGADIIGLQEVSHSPDLLGIADQFDYFESATGFFGAHGPNVVLQDSRYGNALLARWPITDSRLIDLAVAGYEPRGAIDADVDIHGHPLRVIVTHLGLRRRERRRQYAILLDLLGRRPDMPTVIMGDFNSWWPDLGTLRRLGARSHSRRYTVPTFPAVFPLLSLDRIMVWPRGALRRVWAHVTPASRAASDHLPLVGDLVVDTLHGVSGPAPEATPKRVPALGGLDGRRLGAIGGQT